MCVLVFRLICMHGSMFLVLRFVQESYCRSFFENDMLPHFVWWMPTLFIYFFFITPTKCVLTYFYFILFINKVVHVCNLQVTGKWSAACFISIFMISDNLKCVHTSVVGNRRTLLRELKLCQLFPSTLADAQLSWYECTSTLSCEARVNHEVDVYNVFHMVQQCQVCFWSWEYTSQHAQLLECTNFRVVLTGQQRPI